MVEVILMGTMMGMIVSDFFNNPWSIGIGIMVILIVTYIIYKLIRKNHNRSDRSLELLKTKYVSGEISEDDYIRRREILRK